MDMDKHEKLLDRISEEFFRRAGSSPGLWFQVERNSARNRPENMH